MAPSAVKAGSHSMCICPLFINALCNSHWTTLMSAVVFVLDIKIIYQSHMSIDPHTANISASLTDVGEWGQGLCYQPFILHLLFPEIKENCGCCSFKNKYDLAFKTHAFQKGCICYKVARFTPIYLYGDLYNSICICWWKVSCCGLNFSSQCLWDVYEQCSW